MSLLDDKNRPPRPGDQVAPEVAPAKDIIKQQRWETKKEWRATNKEKVTAIKAAYFRRHRERLLAKAKEWRERDREKERARGRAWREKNRERSLAKSKEWREQNPERAIASVMAWKKANPDKVRAIAVKTYRKWADTTPVEEKRAYWREKAAEERRAKGVPTRDELRLSPEERKRRKRERQRAYYQARKAKAKGVGETVTVEYTPAGGGVKCFLSSALLGCVRW